MESAHFLGFGLSSLDKKPTACIALDEELHLAWCDFPLSDAQIIKII